MLSTFSRRAAVTLAGMSLWACSPEPPPVVALDLPDWRLCAQEYGDGGAMQLAFYAGDTRAARCLISLDSYRRELWHSAFETRYLIYMVEDIEPEGLDALVRSTDRQDLAASIRIAHMRLGGLEKIETHWLTFCSVYPPKTRALLLRAPMGADTTCLPRGQR